MKPFYERRTVRLADITKPEGPFDEEKLKALVRVAEAGGSVPAIVLWANGNRLEIIDGRYRYAASVAMGYTKGNAYVLHGPRELIERLARAIHSLIEDGQHRRRGRNPEEAP